MKILITGDLVINTEYIIENIDSSVIELFGRSDLNIVNLEAPVTNSDEKINKTGPNIKSYRDSTIGALKALRVDIATLANNHILDYGEVGVRDTLDFCKEINIKTVGAGMNLYEASRTLYLNSNEGTVAIVNFTENEWSIASIDSAGANPMDIIDNAKQIKNARSKADYVIVIVHGGHEFYNLPSPRIQKQYRFYADQGADIIVGHHTHCVSGHEVWNGVPIYYSLGNFLFTHDSPQPDWYKGNILEINITDKNLFTQVYPVEQSKGNYKLKLIKGEDKIGIEERIERYSNIIQSEDKLLNSWNRYVSQESNIYITRWSIISFIRNPYLRAILNKIGLKINSKSALKLFLNLMRCESHSDLSKEIIEKYINE